MGTSQPAAKVETDTRETSAEEYRDKIIREADELEKRVYGRNEHGSLNMQGPEFTTAERETIISAMDALRTILQTERNEYNDLIRAEGVDSDVVKRSSFNDRCAQLQERIDSYENLLKPKSEEV